MIVDPPFKSAFQSKWVFGDIVTIDGDRTIKGSVTGFAFRVTRSPTVEVSYFHNGESKTAWVEEWRLSMEDAAKRDSFNIG